MTPLLAICLVAVFGAVCALAGGLWVRLRQGDLLRDAALGRQQLQELAAGWLWETDAGHRLRLWRPPATQAGGWQETMPLGEPLWQAVRPAAAAAALQRQMASGALLGEQRLALAFGATAQVWVLRGLPRHDGRGRFLGYVGSAQPADAGEAAEFAQSTLVQVWPQARSALLLFRRAEAGAAAWRLAQASAPALQLLALEPEALADGAPPLDWQAACHRLPAPVAAALAELPAGQARTVDEWTLQWSAIETHDDAQAGRLLMLRRTDDEPPAQTHQQANDSADHESFVYSVSHDLRAPIRVVEGFARILKEDYGRALDRIGNDHVDRVLAAAARMNSMIDALLALSRLQSQPLKRQPVDLSQLATYILEDLRREHPERVVEQSIEPGLVIHGDPTLMRIAIENLVGNAWKYSSQNPCARIALRREQHEGRPCYVVEDNGAGFDMRFADRLFGVFQRLHSAKDFQGTGVGLASVRRIVRRHGGDIWAESEVGKGARFCFTLA